MSESGKAVFLSYASQDKAAAQRIAEALRAAGVEVWFDQSELRGGDAWDALIRKRIKECALFVPIISATTNARAEGYFRLEWKLAVDRSHLMADDAPFLFPIVLGDVADATARVPDKFRDVQWTRLRLDETPAELGARVAKLLGGDGRVESPARPGERRPRNNSTLIGKLGMIMGLTIGLVFALRPIFWNNSRRAAPKPAVVAPAAPAASVSEARQLVAKAHALFEALDSNRDDFTLAEELIAQAKAAGASDAEAWAADAQLNERYFIRGWDTSDARREAARAAAQRALRLDPQSFEARFAQVGLLSYTGREGTDKEQILRELLRERPVDHRVLRELGSTLERQGRTDEGVAFMDKAAALPGGDPLALYNKSLSYWFVGRTVEAEAAMRASITQKPFTGAQLMSVWYAMVLHGDLDGARATLERIAPAELLEDRGCYFAYYLHCLRREPDAAIARLRNMPRDWISDNWYRGPKARLMGDALQMAGRAEAAAVEWHGALKLVDARLAASPTNGNHQFNRILLLASLGERAEAEKQFAVLVQLNGIDPTGAVPVAGWVTELSIALGRKTEALRQIAAGLKQDRRAVTFTAAILRLDPEYDSLRGDPEFQRLIAQAEQIERAAEGKSAAAPKIDDKSIAVLPFENRSAGGEDAAFLADGIHEDLINTISRVPGLRVMSRTAVERFRGTKSTMADIAAALRVSHVVEAGVQRAGNQVRVNVQLVQCSDGQTAWSERYDRVLTADGIFALQEEITAAVAKALKLQLEPGQETKLVTGTTKNLAAYEAFLKGRQLWKTPGASDLEAVAQFKRAVELDPGFALAYGAMAEAYISTGNSGLEAPAKVYPLARAAAERALAIDPRCIQALTALGEYAFHYEWDWEKADRLLREALVVDPNYANVYGWLAGHLTVMNRRAEAKTLSQRKAELEPEQPITRLRNQLETRLEARQFPEAVAIARRIAEQARGKMMGNLILGSTLRQAGQSQEAVQVLEKIGGEFPDQLKLTEELGLSYASLGQADKAREVLQRLAAIRETRYVSPLIFAEMAAALNDREMAFAEIERAFQQRDPSLPGISVNEELASLRDDPRYRDILKRLKLDTIFPGVAKP